MPAQTRLLRLLCWLFPQTMAVRDGHINDEVHSRMANERAKVHQAGYRRGAESTLELATHALRAWGYHGLVRRVELATYQSPRCPDCVRAIKIAHMQRDGTLPHVA